VANSPTKTRTMILSPLRNEPLLFAKGKFHLHPGLFGLLLCHLELILVDKVSNDLLQRDVVHLAEVRVNTLPVEGDLGHSRVNQMEVPLGDVRVDLSDGIQVLEKGQERRERGSVGQSGSEAFENLFGVVELDSANVKVLCQIIKVLVHLIVEGKELVVDGLSINCFQSLKNGWERRVRATPRIKIKIKNKNKNTSITSGRPEASNSPLR